MSYIPPQQLEGVSLIVQYVVNCRAKGHFLTDEDHSIIKKWLLESEDAETLLLILSDFLPDFYAKAKHLSSPPSLKRVERKILRILTERRKRNQFAIEG